MVSIRLRRLIRHLLSTGWDIWCLCPQLGKFPPEPHPALHINVFSMATSQAGLWNKCKRKLLFPIWAILQGRKLTKQFTIRHVFCTIPEIEAFVAGVGIKKACGNKTSLTVEVRDPFSPNATYPWSELKRKLYSKLERTLWRYPDKAIFLTSEIERIYLGTFGAHQRWTRHHRVVTNGFDPSEYPTIQQEAHSNRLQMTYIGSFYDSRHPLAFLEALKSFLEMSTDIPRADVRFFGAVHGESLKARVSALCQKAPLREVVHWAGEVSHSDAIRAMRSADVNLLITHESGSEYAIPGKIFEYMGTGKPILALTHDPLVIRMMKEGALGWICQTPDELRQWFERYLPRAAEVRAHRTNSEAIQRYQINTIHKRWEDFLEVAST